MNFVESDFLHVVIRHLPLFVVCAAGVILAAFMWRRHALSACLALLGATLSAIGRGVYLYWEFACIPELEAQNAVPELLDELILHGTPYLEAIGLALLLAAAFVGRAEARRTARYDDE